MNADACSNFACQSPLRYQNRHTGEQSELFYWSFPRGAREQVAVFTPKPGQAIPETWSESLLSEHWQKLPCGCGDHKVSLVL